MVTWFDGTQLKEKFGLLRAYTSLAGDPNAQGHIDHATFKSGRTCERCGAPGRLVDDDQAYVRTLCAAHADEHRFDRGQIALVRSTGGPN